MSRAHKPRAHKPIHLKPKHARPVLKRHVLSLALLSAVLVMLCWELAALISGRSLLIGQVSTVADQLIEPASSSLVTVRSSLGFNYVVNLDQYRLAAQTSQNGQAKTYEGSAASTERAYAALSLDPKQPLDLPRVNLSVESTPDYGQLARQYGADRHEILAARAYADQTTADHDIVTIDQALESNGGRIFYRLSYKVVPKMISRGGFMAATVRTDLYITLINDRPLVIKLSSPTLDDATSRANGHSVLNNLSVGDKLSAAVRALPGLSLPNVSWAAPVKAATASTDVQNKNFIKYTPAVVKIYHRVCGILEVNGAEVGQNGCDGDTGSGFIVSADGYVATNGHVVTLSAKDIVVSQILSDSTAFNTFFKQLGFSVDEIAKVNEAMNASPAAALSIIKGIYDLPDSKLRIKNSREDYLVALGKQPLDTTDILNPNKQLVANSKVKSAKLVATDYSGYDMYSVALQQGFTGSDVALLKLDGSNFPVVRLGQVGTLTQGAPVTVIGFPGNAENSISDDSTISPSVTKGTVSAIKNAAGNDKKIVQSDVSISHGNSGGPALDDSGRVFGLATYTYDSGTSGDSNVSYMRDIKDLQDLAKSKGFNLVDQSAVQTEWEKGVDYFFAARFSKAIKNFEKVESMYPAHNMAADYIDIAKAKIANGEEVKDGTIYFVIGGVLAVIAVISVVIVVIIKHHGKHQVYKVTQQGVAVLTGKPQTPAAATPQTPPTPPQKV